MFDFAKSGPKVYAHPIPGYPERRWSRLARLLIIVLGTGVLLVAISFLDFSAFESSAPPEQPIAIDEPGTPPDQGPLIRPIPVKPNDDVELTPGLDLTAGAQADNAQATEVAETREPAPVEVKPASLGGWQEHKIAAGDSLSTIFDDLGLKQSLLIRISNSASKEHGLSRIKPGQIFKVKLNDKGEFEQLIWRKSAIESLSITPTETGFEFKKERKPLERREGRSSGIIENSLFIDGQNAGLSDNLIMELAEIFQWDVDFALGLRKGDRFSLIYDAYYLDGKQYDNGDIIAAEFVNRGKRYRAIRYEHKDGRIGYYTADGKSMRKEFIMTPVAFTRISSGFTPKRWHPVLKKWRAHRGVDYAAPTGTPVKAAGDGKITYNGWKGGYGRVVMVQHQRKHTTVYGHLSAFAKRNSVGNLVKQGQIIGYVGKSGLATGPHLHYELRVAGKYTDPLKVTALPASRGIPDKDFKRFKAHASKLLTQLAIANSDDQLAQLNTSHRKH
jgi:murein DD-endopeptidase MepM/ murein hydrolase activator NlpD